MSLARVFLAVGADALVALGALLGASLLAGAAAHGQEVNPPPVPMPSPQAAAVPYGADRPQVIIQVSPAPVAAPAPFAVPQQFAAPSSGCYSSSYTLPSVQSFGSAQSSYSSYSSGYAAPGSWPAFIGSAAPSAAVQTYAPKRVIPGIGLVYDLQDRLMARRVSRIARYQAYYNVRAARLSQRFTPAAASVQYAAPAVQYAAPSVFAIPQAECVRCVLP